MKYNIKIGDISFEAEITPSLPVEIPNVIDKPIEWNGEDLELEGGKDYFIPYHSTPSIKEKKITIKSKGEERANLFFGVDGMSKWVGDHKRFLFDCGNDCDITIKDVNLFTVNVAQEVDPFYHTIFTGSGINQKLNLINVDTNMESSLLYSASQEVTQVLYQENIRFKGYIYQELKANKGGGLKSIIRKADLKQIDPPHYFKSDFIFTNSVVESSVLFSSIENTFHSQQKQNACNILYVEGMTFCLPWGLQLGNTHPIRRIPEIGEAITLTQGNEFLQSNMWELQSGDILEIDGIEETIISKDRPRSGFKESDYSIDYNLGKKFEGTIKAIVKKSKGLKLIGKKSEGYMIFKDNKHFQTNIENNLDLEYYLKSNPLGVLSYNHEEITVDWKDLNHDGFYRQSRSNVGKSNGYLIDNCKGLKDQFKIPTI